MATAPEAIRITAAIAAFLIASGAVIVSYIAHRIGM